MQSITFDSSSYKIKTLIFKKKLMGYFSILYNVKHLILYVKMNKYTHLIHLANSLLINDNITCIM